MTVDLLRQLQQLRERTEDAVLATLIASDGGSSKRVGSRMWVTAEGKRIGSLTVGGCVDQQVADVAEVVIRTGRPERFSVDLRSEDGFESGMTCAAAVEVFVERIRVNDYTSAPIKAIEALGNAQRERVPALLLTELGARGTCAVLRAEAVAGETEEWAAFRPLFGGPPGATKRVGTEPSGVEVFGEVFGIPSTLVIIGAAPIAQPLATLARSVGFRTMLIESLEDRVEPETAAAFDEVRIGIPSEICGQMTVDDETYVVIVAHDYKFEVPVLTVLAGRPVRYLGMVAGRRRGRSVLDFVAGKGVAREALERVRTPVGIRLGGSSPTEIALSIMAEILMVRHGLSNTDQAV